MLKDIGSNFLIFRDVYQGKNDADALEMAKDALRLWLDKTDEVVDREIRKPSSLLDIQKQYPDDIVMLIEGDQEYYARKHNTKAVKKTLSIPQRLNDKAIKANINFSQVLQEALSYIDNFLVLSSKYFFNVYNYQFF